MERFGVTAEDLADCIMRALGFAVPDDHYWQLSIGDLASQEEGCLLERGRGERIHK